MTWDGRQNRVFCKMDGRGPSAIVELAAGDFQVTCYDSGSIVRISPESKTVAEYKQDNVGQRSIGPNDFTADKKGGVYFTASGPWESDPIVGKIFVRIGQVDPDSGRYAYPDGLKMDSNENLFIGQYSKGRIIFVSQDRKLVKTIDVPSPAAPNLNFGRGEAVVYIMAVDGQNNAPYWGKVYEEPNK